MTARAEIDGDGITVEAAEIAGGFGLTAEAVPALLRAGAITSRLERGEGEDAGTFRLTFFHRNARFTMIVSAAGDVLRRSTVDFGASALPPTLRRR